jgi:alpha-tubulin suppressor-like RCC1 family protein
MRTARWTLTSLPALLLLGGSLACHEDAAPTGPTTERTALNAAAVAPLSFRQLTTGTNHTCGVTTTNKAYCWGYNGFSIIGGQLGDGTNTRRLKPVAVLGGLPFSQISAGGDHTCGVTTDDRAYCWGRNDYGQLGDGTTVSKLTPVPVAGSRRFRVVSAGNFHSCGITPANVLFCWGTNRYGVMGAAAAPNHTPVKVGGAITWRNVSAGYSHSCGATTTNEAYCWGNNSNYQIGNGTGSLVAQPPTKVSGGLSWRQVFAGSGYISESSDDPAPDHALSCGITTADRVYCWGSGAASSTPKEIIGGRRYTQINAGVSGCGVRGTGVIDCWTSESITKVASGTLRFLRVSTSGIAGHRCAVATDNKAYCWGDNSDGQLGTGTTNPSATPVAVAAPD